MFEISSELDSGIINITETLIERCRAGDRKAQFDIYKLYYKAMYNTSLRIVNNTQEAEDIMQESFISAFGNISDYNGMASFGTWLKKIVVNRSLDFLKRKKPELVVTDENMNIIPEEITDEDTDCTTEKVETIRKAIFSLPDGYRIILSLYLLEGYDHEEIAGILNITSSTSRSQFTRARRKLINQLKTGN